MNVRAHILCLPLLAALAGTAWAGRVEVEFVHPESYADLGTNRSDEQQNMDIIARHLQGLGETGLPADQTLRIEFQEIDLAGTVEPSRASVNAVRVITGRADSPHMRLHWVLTGPGLERSGDEQLSDLNYTRGLTGRGDSTPLFYDKRMLSDWFRARFAGGHSD